MIEMIEKVKEIINLVVDLSGDENVYLAGGHLRDLLLGRDSDDLDFVVSHHPQRIAVSLADRIGGSYFSMDEEHQVHRVVDNTTTYDFSQLRAESIQDDLRLRDFTINALAISVDEIASTGGRLDLERLIDPCRGREDIKEKKIRVVYQRAFIDDPIRMLRALRLGAQLGFEIEAETLGSILEHKHLLMPPRPREAASIDGGWEADHNSKKGASAERIRDEIGGILSLSKSSPYLRKLDELGLLGLIMPEIEMMKGVEQGGYHHLDVWQHSLLVLERLEAILAQPDSFFGALGSEVIENLAQEISGRRPLATVLKLSALLHDVGKPETKIIKEDGGIKFYGHESEAIPTVSGIADDLRLSAHERFLLKNIVSNHMHVGHLSRDVPPSKRAMLRFFRKTTQAGVAVIVLALADGQSINGFYKDPTLYGKLTSTVRAMLEFYYIELKAEKPQRYINGNDIIDNFPLEQGPIVGRLLESVEEAVVEGIVKSREDAMRLVADMLERHQASIGQEVYDG